MNNIITTKKSELKSVVSVFVSSSCERFVASMPARPGPSNSVADAEIVKETLAGSCVSLYWKVWPRPAVIPGLRFPVCLAMLLFITAANHNPA